MNGPQSTVHGRVGVGSESGVLIETVAGCPVGRCQFDVQAFDANFTSPIQGSDIVTSYAQASQRLLSLG